MITSKVVILDFITTLKDIIKVLEIILIIGFIPST
jgi:hypothetical protein